MHNRDKLTAEYARSRLEYDPLVGNFTWKPKPVRPEFISEDRRWNSRFAGKTAGCVRKDLNGNWYRLISFGEVQYKAHRLAWLMMTGSWPDGQIDHIDCDGRNNVFSNLRLASPFENCANRKTPSNNRSGFKGVRYRPRDQTFEASIMKEGKRYYLGSFGSAEAASAAYSAAAAELNGDFARVA